MGLDVGLSGNRHVEKCVCPRCANEHEIDTEDEYFDANITHNLADMARAAGIYTCLWMPEEIGVTTAAQLIEPLRAGLASLKSAPDEYRKFNAPQRMGHL